MGLERHVFCAGADDTRAAGVKLSQQWARGGAVIALCGDLGAGKTVFAKGFCEALGVPQDAVTSPTFTLLNIYEGATLRVYHLDLYRLGSAQEAESAGLFDYIGAADAVTLIEWPERVPGIRYDICVTVTVTDGGREVVIAG
jgi:tRNA threonylcarbamoyladenosine biosynthesis protein TsaE